MACKPISLNDLPEEILLIVLSHMGPEDIFRNITKVCKRWNALTKEKTLWKKVSYNCGRSRFSRIVKVLKNAPALHSLVIRERKDAARILEYLLDIHCGLRKLIVEDCSLGWGSSFLLADIVDSCPDLEVLSLACCRQLRAAGYYQIIRLNKLSELKLSGCQGLIGETVRLIADSCQHLKKLRLFDVRLIDADVIHVIKKLGKQLTALHLNGDRLTDVGYSYLKNCARLQELEITFCDIMTGEGLLQGIGSLQELTHLCLTLGTNLTAQALSTFLHRQSVSSIVCLKLSLCCNLDDEGLKGIAERCIHLEELTVGGDCNVTDAGISMVISHCSRLSVLSLTCITSITGKGFLALIPSNLLHLRRLCLSGCCNLCHEYVEELLAAAPDLKVIK